MSNDKLYQVITSNFANKKVCVFSEGKPEDFGEVKELDYVKFMLNGQADYPFHNFVMAPELVLAKSSLSYTAALLNQGKVYYVDNLMHSPLSHWTQAKLTNDPTLQPVLEKVSEEESLCEEAPADLTSDPKALVTTGYWTVKSKKIMEERIGARSRQRGQQHAQSKPLHACHGGGHGSQCRYCHQRR